MNVFLFIFNLDHIRYCWRVFIYSKKYLEVHVSILMPFDFASLYFSFNLPIFHLLQLFELASFTILDFCITKVFKNVNYLFIESIVEDLFFFVPLSRLIDTLFFCKILYIFKSFQKNSYHILFIISAYKIVPLILVERLDLSHIARFS